MLAEVLGEPRLATFTDKDTWSRQDEITDLIALRLKTATTSEWVARMEPLKIWHAPVQGYAQIAEDAQVKHMKSLVTVPGAGETGAPVTLVNHPISYDGEPPRCACRRSSWARKRRRYLASSGSMPRRSRHSPTPRSSSCRSR